MADWHVSRTVRAATLATALIGMALSTGSAGAQTATVAGPETTWNFSLYTQKGSAVTAGFDNLVTMVGNATGGRFRINQVHNGTLAPVKETLDALRINAFQMGFVAQSFHPGKVPTVNIFDLPFLPFANLKTQVTVMTNYFRLPEVVADAARWNTFILMPPNLTSYELAGKGKPPRSIADLKGMRIRAPGGMGEALRTVGVAPNNLPSPEIYGAVERGMIDALAFPMYAHGTYKTVELVTWYTTNMKLGLVAAFAAINLDAWKALPDAYRNLMLASVPEAMESAFPKVLADDQAMIDALNRRNAVAITYSKAEKDKFIEQAARPIWDKWVEDMNAQGYPGRKLLDFVVANAERGV
ncbi:MAG: TRAP transporter substrate-binding protein DctP [Alphaproteobacteria bacterium]